MAKSHDIPAKSYLRCEAGSLRKVLIAPVKPEQNVILLFRVTKNDKLGVQCLLWLTDSVLNVLSLQIKRQFSYLPVMLTGLWKSSWFHFFPSAGQMMLSIILHFLQTMPSSYTVLIHWQVTMGQTEANGSSPIDFSGCKIEPYMHTYRLVPCLHTKVAWI